MCGGLKTSNNTMGNDSYPVQLAGSATTTIGSAFLYSISINKTLTGTVIVKEGANTIGTLAIGTTAGDYHNLPNGGRYANLSFVLSAGDDVTAYFKKA